MFSNLSSFTEGFKRLSLDALQEDEEQQEKHCTAKRADAPVHEEDGYSDSRPSVLNTVDEQHECNSSNDASKNTHSLASDSQPISATVDDDWSWDHYDQVGEQRKEVPSCVPDANVRAVSSPALGSLAPTGENSTEAVEVVDVASCNRADVQTASGGERDLRAITVPTNTRESGEAAATSAGETEVGADVSPRRGRSRSPRQSGTSEPNADPDLDMPRVAFGEIHDVTCVEGAHDMCMSSAAAESAPTALEEPPALSSTTIPMLGHLKEDGNDEAGSFELTREIPTEKANAVELERVSNTQQAHRWGADAELRREKDDNQEEAKELRFLRDEAENAKIGFREANEAHQRTAKRVEELGNQLEQARNKILHLEDEANAWKEQVTSVAVDRDSLEREVRQLRNDLADGRDGARDEARREIVRLEARLKEVVKDRDRKQAELDLQNARHKETREMARDLESQLAATDRLSHEREAELVQLKAEVASLSEKAADAKDEAALKISQYNSLEKNFKQVRGECRQALAEVERLQRDASVAEAERVALAEKVEDEGAEQVTVVTAISHERDFLLRQVDRLERELANARKMHEQQDAVNTERAQTASALEEYRNRAQQALKQANEMRIQTSAENKHLQAQVAALSAELDRERPRRLEAQDSESATRQSMKELQDKLEDAGNERRAIEMEKESARTRAAEEEAARSSMHATITRLEAQGKSLKQELQRQQKALSSASDREAQLRRVLSNKEKALQEITSKEPKDTDKDEAAYAHDDNDDCEGSPSSPPMEPRLSPRRRRRSSDEEQAPGVEISPRNMTGVIDAQRVTKRDSINSIVSDTDSADWQAGNVAEQLVYVHQLRERMAKEQTEMRGLIGELETLRTAVDAQSRKETRLEKQLEAALLDKRRLQELDSGRNASINLEYLKNCVVGCLRTSEPSEHARLLPVITRILKLSKDEADTIARNISNRAQHQGSFGGGGGGIRGAPASSGGRTSWWNSRTTQKKHGF